jgi:hypothetical protein
VNPLFFLDFSSDLYLLFGLLLITSPIWIAVLWVVEEMIDRKKHKQQGD